MKRREVRVSQAEGPCQRCTLHAALRSLDLAVTEDRGAARRGVVRGLRGSLGAQPAVPAGWCPLIALCGLCWIDVVDMLRAQARPDASGTVSP